MAWEATALDLAARCGIAKPQHRLVKVSDLSVLLVDRFDRVGLPGGGSAGHMDHRIPYISAMTILDKSEGAESDYLEIVEMMRAHGATLDKTFVNCGVGSHFRSPLTMWTTI
jgi:serine/threonine-protein kinase HipA